MNDFMSWFLIIIKIYEVDSKYLYISFNKTNLSLLSKKLIIYYIQYNIIKLK